MKEKSDLNVIDLAPQQIGRVLKTVSYAELLMSYEPPDWLIPELLERRQHACLFGDSGVGKTAIIVDWMLRLAAGLPIHGHEPPNGEQMGVLYVCNEGRGGMARRVPAWAQHHGRDIYEAEHLPFRMIDEQVLLDENGAFNIMTTMSDFERTHGIPVSLIVIDTLAASFAGMDENSNSDMQRHCGLVSQLTGMGPSVLEVHHTGHGEKTRARGASALKGALDVEMRAWSVTPGQGLIIVEATKLKDATGLGRLPYQLSGHAILGEMGSPTGVEAVVASEHKLNEQVPANSYQSWGVLVGIYKAQLATLSRGGQPEPAQVIVMEEEWRDELEHGSLIISKNKRVRDKQFSKITTDLRNAGLLRPAGLDGWAPLGLETLG